jgi:hypothetical protein
MEELNVQDGFRIIPLVLFNLSESRDEILFKGGRFVTP